MLLKLIQPRAFDIAAKQSCWLVKLFNLLYVTVNTKLCAIDLNVK